MGFLGMSGKTWKKVGKYALKAAPIVAAPFTGGASLLALGAGAGALSGALDGGGWKGALMGGALGAVPGGGGAGSAAGSVAKTGLKAGLTQAAKTGGKQIAGGLASKYIPGTAGQVAGAAIGGFGGGGNLGANLRSAGKAALTQGGATAASRIPGVGGIAGNAVGAGIGSALNGTPGASFGQNLRTAGKAALGGAQAGGVDMAGNYAMNSILPQQGGWAGGGGGGGNGNFGGIEWSNGPTTAPGGGARKVPNTGFGASPRPGQGPGNSFADPNPGDRGGIQKGQPGAGDGGGGGFGGFWEDWGGPITTGVGLGVGGYVGKKAQENAMKRSPEEMRALQGAQGVAGDTAAAAKGMLGQSKPWMQQTGNYYSTLLSGNRAAQAQAVAAPMAQISQQYRGAERGLERSGVRGAARDVAAGELGRERVSKMAGLTTGVQGAAADALGTLGLNMGNQAGALYGTSGQINTNLLAQGQLNRKYAREEGGKAAEQAGKIAHDLGTAVSNSTRKKTPAATPPIGQTPIPQIPRAPGTGGVPLPTPGNMPSPFPKTPAPRPTTPYPGGRVTPPILGGPPTGDYDPTKQYGRGIHF